MIKVFNPIYDSVFKYLMENDRVPKIILGSNKKKRKTSLEKILSIFDQTQKKDRKYIEIDDNLDSSPDYQEIMKALIKATADFKVRGDIELEEEMENEFAERDNTILKLKAEVDEQKNQIDEQKNQIVEKDNQLIEQKNKLVEKDNQLLIKKNQLVEKDKKMAKKLLSLGNSIEEISEFLSIDIQKVKEYLE